MARKPAMGIRFKLCCSYMALVLLPTLLAGMLLYARTIGNIRAQIGADLDAEMREQASDIDQRERQMEEAAKNFMTLNEITRYISGLYFDESELIIAYNQRIRAAFQWFDNTAPSPMRINFFIDSDAVSEDGHFHCMRVYAKEPWLLRASSALAQQSSYWEGAHAARSYRYAPGGEARVFSLFLSSPLLKNAILELEIGVQELVGQRPRFACLNADTLEVLCAQANLPVGVQLQVSADLLENAAHTLVETTFGDAQILLRSVKLSDLNAYLVHWTEYASMKDMVRSALGMFCGILIPLTVLLFALTWILSGRMSLRVRRITDAVESMYHNRYDIRLPVDSTDELGALAWHMNEMAERIDNLLNKVLLAEMAAKDAQLSALQSQINPHFIYNSLETFCMMAELGDNGNLGEGIAEMGELMRYNLSGRREATLREEIDNVRLYTNLQNIVNNDRITLKVLSDPALDDLPMPKLLLQPLVENAILHGMDPRRNLHIEVNIRKSGTGVCIRVGNDGKPIRPDRLRQIQRMLSRNSVDPLASFDDCLALMNISRRLKLLYDMRATVGVLSDTHGTQVRIDIPYGRDSA